MKIYEDISYKDDEHLITGFINTQNELEYTIYKSLDGGTFSLEDRKYEKEEFTDLLEIELKDFIDRNKSTVTIVGHEIRLVSIDGRLIKDIDLDEEVYEINQSILDGYDCGEVFLKSKSLMCLWKIVK